MLSLTTLLPDHMVSCLLSEWLDPEKDLRVFSGTFEPDVFRRLVTQPGFEVRPATIMLYETVSWLSRAGIRARPPETKRWYDQNGQLHRDGGGPAEVWPDGHQVWYQHGKIHRDDLPAVVYADGRSDWYQHGKIHRDDLPAVVYADGRSDWYQHGQRHRDHDLPAIVCGGGSGGHQEEWYVPVRQAIPPQRSARSRLWQRRTPLVRQEQPAAPPQRTRAYRRLH